MYKVVGTTTPVEGSTTYPQPPPNHITDNIALLGATDMWKKGIRGEGIIIGVIDTGIDGNHPDLQGQVIHQHNFTSDYGNPNNATDNNGHGTHCSGILAAKGVGITGMAPGAKLVALKAMNSQGMGSLTSIAAAVSYAANWRGDNGEKIDILSMSVGGKIDSPVLHEAVKKAKSAGIAVFAAAGNDGDGNPDTAETSYPADYPEAMAVGAYASKNQVAPFSDSNPAVAIVTPGVHVLSCWLNGHYICEDGTSMATPGAAGAAALVMQSFNARFGAKPMPDELYKLLMGDATELGLPKDEEGAGLLKVRPVGGIMPLRLATQYLASPQYWMNLANKIDSGAKVTTFDVQYVPLEIRKMAQQIFDLKK